MYGLEGLCTTRKQEQGEEVINRGLDLPDMGIALKQGVAKKLFSPFAEQQPSDTGLQSFNLPACYAQ